MALKITPNPDEVGRLSISANQNARMSSIVTIGWGAITGKAAIYSGLDALASTGLITATDTSGGISARLLSAPAAGFTITNPGGIAGNPTFALANDLAALEAMSGTGIVARTASETYAQRTITAPAAGITVSNGDGVSGNPTLALANDLSAVEGLSSTGIARRTGTDTWSVGTAVANSELATMAAYTFKVNNTGSSATPTDVDIASLTTKGTPATTDYVILSDQAASGALKKATVSSLTSGSGVSSIAGNTGAFTLSNGLTNSTNDLQIASAYRSRVLLNTLTANNTTGTLSDTSSLTSAYDDYEIVIENLLPATTNNTCLLQVRQSGGAFQTTTYLTVITQFSSVGISTATATNGLLLSQATTLVNTGVGVSGTFRVYGPVTGTSVAKQWTGSSSHGAANNPTGVQLIGFWNNTAAIDGIQIVANVGGNWTSGVVKIYGLR